MSNTLEKEDVDLFFKLYSSLLSFVVREANGFPNFSPDDFLQLSVDDRRKISNILFNRKEYIDQFIQNPHVHLSHDEVAIISSWKHFVKGQFFIYKHLKTYSVFINSEKEKAFAVSGISQPLENLYPYPPVLIETVLLPFKDRIIYHGIIAGFSIHFGPGIRDSIKDAYEKAKHQPGLITQLPWNEGDEEKSDIETLKFYMKNKSNRDLYWDEIVKISLKNKQLTDLFYQEMGKTHVSHFSKSLKKIGLEKRWFGIIDNTIVASGMTKNQLQKNIDEVIPENKVNRIHIFKT